MYYMLGFSNVYVLHTRKPYAPGAGTAKPPDRQNAPTIKGWGRLLRWEGWYLEPDPVAIRLSTPWSTGGDRNITAVFGF